MKRVSPTTAPLLLALLLIAGPGRALAPAPADEPAAEPVAAAETTAPADTALVGPPAPQRAPVLLDGVPVYWSAAPDSAAAVVAADSILVGLLDCRARLRDLERLTLEEQDAGAVLRLDSLTLLVLRPENRVDEARSPLANALALRRQLVQPLLATGGRAEEELALRLFLGIVFPLLLLVVLRSTRYGLRRWELRWRGPLRKGLESLAEQRRFDLSPGRIQNIIRGLTGLERLLTYGVIAALVSFLWFAIFPETRPLAITLLNRGLGPIVDLLGATARGFLALVYSLFILALAFLTNRWLGGHWRRGPTGPLGDPAVNIPLRTGILLLAIFLILFPFAGAPRLLALVFLLLVVLVALIALRPVYEEIACGIYLNATHTLRAGDRILLEDEPEALDIVRLGLAQILVADADSERWIPYSRLLKAKLAIQRGGGRRL